MHTKTNIMIVGAMTALSVWPHPVFAAEGIFNQSTMDCLTNNPNLNCVNILVADVIDFLLGLAGAAAILFLILGAYDYIIGWTIEMKQQAKARIGYAIGGLVLISLAYILVQTVTKGLF